MIVVQEAIPADRAGPRRVRALAVLGDSVGAGMGDPVAGGWRGFAPLLAEALGAAELANVSSSGARVADVHSTQLPAALRAAPEAAVVLVGMNDTMRYDFDPPRLRRLLTDVVRALTAAGTIVVTIRYHDHGRVFRLPGPLRAALARRIDALNRILEEVAEEHAAGIVDLDRLPGVYHPRTWSVDRLHPSELGHRLLAASLAEEFQTVGVAVPGEVSLAASGGIRTSGFDHLRWLVGKGLPWLLVRGHYLIRYCLRVLVRAALQRFSAPSSGSGPA
ncbi:Lysophospholipase L1 [Saccharopolyspora kobensis]|uniref:Lysophospholipase L1 n=1 Tax=Saccharopolyspora kobensis TaxID=146035 RepID=A0A1H5UGB0_9PSEU|nr:SGNH/GDSL hydrolase family protein [Saccharopolyspora kobensis]SEF73391.1 Lysophospholipase L1 [Saccharopolyspora kobensis]SFC74336.1 Lysophospholipase L1 [Saccharopolyspora kobensis]